MEIFIIISQFILSLSLLIVLHEMGHFFPAKAFKTKVEKFYLFFDPWFSLFKVKRGETEYGVGWLPLGGYVKIAGMVDESMDREQMNQPPKPWEFRSKPAWQRLIIMMGGVVVNFLLGFLIFGLLLFTYGEEYLPPENATYGIAVDSLGKEIGLRAGYHVLKVGYLDLEKFNDRQVVREVVLSDARTLTVRRNGRTQTVEIPDSTAKYLASANGSQQILYFPRLPFVAGQVKDGSAADNGGLQEGDSLVTINGEELVFFDRFKDKIVSSAGEELTIGYYRNGERQQLTVSLDEKAILGVLPYGADRFFEMQRKEYGFLPALWGGVKKGSRFLGDQIRAFSQMFGGNIKASESLGGFITIGKLFPPEWQWQSFWTVTAILSLILGFVNLLPIPALDGGHVMFLLYEIISGRKPNERVVEYATLAGILILLSLLIYANGLDIMRFFN
jgi:regulator of sigma E protease